MSRVPQNLAAPLRQLAKQAVGADWQLYSIVLEHWQDIIGQEWAAQTAPVKIAFPRQSARAQGTLTIAMPRGLTMAMQYRQPQILARLNAFLGAETIVRLHFTHVTTAPPRPPVPDRVLSASEAAQIGQAVASVSDAALRASLEAFGQALYTAQRMPGEAAKP